MKSFLNEMVFFMIIIPVFFLIIKKIFSSILNKEWLKRFCFFGFIISSIISLYLIYGIWAKQHLVVYEEEINIEDYDGEEFEVAVISDLHLGKFNNTAVSEKAIEKINSRESSKYVFVLGDILNSLEKDLSEIDILCEFDENKEVFFIYGNHDYSYSGERFNKIEEKLNKCNIRVLKNDMVQLDNGVYVAGSLDIWYDPVKFDYLDNLAEGESIILLAHNPDVIQFAPDQVDLMLSGHTHGGELRFPGIGGLAPLPTKLDDSYDKGFFVYDDKDLFITSTILG